MHATYTSATIVLLGTFVPGKYAPDKLVEAKILSKKDGELANYKALLAGTVLEYSLPWAQVMVTQDRFQVATTEAPFVRICDFVTKAIHDNPTGSFVVQFGINLESHYEFESMEARDLFAQNIAPPLAWGAWGQELLNSMKGPDATHGGVTLLQLRQPFIAEKVTGWLEVNVGPSTRIQKAKGIFLRTNHHHQILASSTEAEEANKAMSATADPLALLEILAARFDESISAAQKIFGDVLSTSVT